MDLTKHNSTGIRLRTRSSSSSVDTSTGTDIQREEETNRDRFDTLVLAGNSTNVVITLGALQYLMENTTDLANISTYFGTSSGSIVNIMLAIGYQPLELLTYLCVNNVYTKIPLFNLANLFFKGTGLIQFTPIEEELNTLITRRVPPDCLPLTFRILKERYGKIFVCVTYNLTKCVREYMSAETHPDTPILTAIKMSCSFPFIFDPVEYKGEFYIDGGITDNFPIVHAERIGKRCIGVLSHSPSDKYEAGMGFIKLFIHIMKVFTQSSTMDKTQTVAQSRVIVLNHPTNFFNFTSSSKDLITMFDQGYSLCAEDRKPRAMPANGKVHID